LASSAVLEALQGQHHEAAQSAIPSGHRRQAILGGRVDQDRPRLIRSVAAEAVRQGDAGGDGHRLSRHVDR
jgi:hypothetical protein